MRMLLNGATLFAGLLLAGVAVMADGTRFSDFTPLPASAAPTADESMPLTFGNPAFEQRSIADRETQLAFGIPNSGNWDMNTVNETGPHKGRYLFTVFETGQSGVQRHDLLTGVTETIWYSPAASPSLQSHVAFDPAYWTPWGTLITGRGKLVHCRRRMHGEPLRSPLRIEEPRRCPGHCRTAV